MDPTAAGLNNVYHPSKEVVKKATVKNYDALYQQSIENREEFWATEARRLDWYKKWDKVLDDSNRPFYKWFTGGQINIFITALDRHQKNATRNKMAIIWEGEPGDVRTPLVSCIEPRGYQVLKCSPGHGCKKRRGGYHLYAPDT